MRLAFAAFLVLAATPVHAGLEWDNPSREFKRIPGDPPVDVSFGFRNTGSTPVRILKVSTTCGCTTARLDKNTFAPGEAGGIAVRFDFGGRAGLSKKQILVEVEGQPTAAVLDIAVHVLEPMEITPRLVYWTIGETPAPRTVRLAAPPETPVRVLRVHSSNPGFTARLETVKEGHEYNLVITPAATTARDRAGFTVETDFPPERPRAYTIHARVK